MSFELLTPCRLQNQRPGGDGPILVALNLQEKVKSQALILSHLTPSPLLTLPLGPGKFDPSEGVKGQPGLRGAGAP